MADSKGELKEIFGNNGPVARKMWGKPKHVTGKKPPPQLPKRGSKKK